MDALPSARLGLGAGGRFRCDFDTALGLSSSSRRRSMGHPPLSAALAWRATTRTSGQVGRVAWSRKFRLLNDFLRHSGRARPSRVSANRGKRASRLPVSKPKSRRTAGCTSFVECAEWPHSAYHHGSRLSASHCAHHRRDYGGSQRQQKQAQALGFASPRVHQL